MNTAKKAALVIAAAGVAAGASTGSAFAHNADAQGKAVNSPGVGSGNLVQAPVHVPVNVTGNSVNVVGVLNPAFGNHTHNN
ncbi:chaplin [Streptomyces smyrnaeus]|uniref:Chaplin n=1 Tax=Streptomyces smyrnaeus TaxID=1387713 RepID=A0ABS3XS67_9ACTN|nr:chaplin [Streptomyces smyrnaeus]MBO8198251.1 chaplin [Streptomyces smyrnaeus]